jgi:O-antigen ligase
MGFTTLIKSNPLIGFGTGMHGNAIYNQSILENNVNVTNYLSSVSKMGPILLPDCEYNSIILQFGIIGLFIYLNLFFQTSQYKQADLKLKEVQNMILFSSVFYAIVSSLLFGILVPNIFIVLLTLTLVKDRIPPRNSTLSPMTSSTILAYTFGTASLFVLCKVT